MDLTRLSHVCLCVGRHVRRPFWPFVQISLVAAMGCGPSGQYVWVDQVPSSSFTLRDAPQYVVAPGDLLNVRVYGQDALSAHARVRTDGKLTIPLAGDVAMAGRTTDQLAAAIGPRLKDYVKDPSVSVTVEEIAPISVTVLGEVSRPGVISMERRAGVLDAIASAGGLDRLRFPRESFPSSQRWHGPVWAHSFFLRRARPR